MSVLRLNILVIIYGLYKGKVKFVYVPWLVGYKTTPLVQKRNSYSITDLNSSI